jgi:hypothetical protein
MCLPSIPIDPRVALTGKISYLNRILPSKLTIMVSIGSGGDEKNSRKAVASNVADDVNQDSIDSDGMNHEDGPTSTFS